MSLPMHRVCPLLLALSLLTASACGGDDDESTTPTPPPQPALYAVQSMTFGADGRATYVALLPSVDAQQTVQLGSAREFAEYAPSDPFAGGLIVSAGERPELTRFTITETNQWLQGPTASFAQFTSAPLDAVVYASADKAYVPFDKTNHVKFNPTTFAITGETGASPAIPLTREGGLTVFRGNNSAVSGNLFFQPYYWSDSTYLKYAQTSQINVIDTTTDQVKTPIDVPCPHLHLASKDDQGNWYFSNGQGSIAGAVMDPAAPRNCYARIDAGKDTLDPASVVYFRDLAEGREGSNLFYIGNGRALFNVYHAERDVLTGNSNPTQTITFSPNYHIWTVDLATRKAAIMEGVGYGGGQFITFKVDDRVLVAIPTADYKSTSVYEVTADLRAEKRFDVEGWATKIFRIR
ncbi:MAG: hypothetical protein ABW252_18525 [Polyangiales bacterium]